MSWSKHANYNVNSVLESCTLTLQNEILKSNIGHY